MSSFVHPIEIHSGPAAYRPDIVELPVETSHTATVSSEGINCSLDCKGLHRLRKIRERLKGCSVSYACGVILDVQWQILISQDVPLVKPHHITVQVAILRACEFKNGAVLEH